MPANTHFRSPSSSDAAILTALMAIADELEQDARQSLVTVQVMDGYQASDRFQLAGIQKQPFAEQARQHESASWHRVLVQFEPLRLNVRVERDRERGDDQIHVSFQQDPPDPVDVSRALTAIQQQFIPLNRAAAIERALGPEMAEFYRLREEGLSRLEALTNRLTSETQEYRIRLDAEAAEHKRALTKSFEEKNRVLDANHDERTKGLEARETELDERRQELDDRSARHARREQLKVLQQKISDRSKTFKLTSDTHRKRMPVHLIFTFLLALSGGLIAHSFFSPATATEGVELWLQLGRLPLGALGFGLSAVFYIRWTDQWFRRHADQEFRLQQLALDVDRAGYATEMLLEWQEDKGGELPAVMVDRLTAGLFTDQTTAARVRHPSEDVVAELLKGSSKIRFDLPGIGEATLTGRQFRKLDENREGHRQN